MSTLFRLLLSMILLASVFNTKSFAFNPDEDDNEIKGVSIQLLQKRPELPIPDSQKQQSLGVLASKGDQDAQDQLVERNYWEFLDAHEAPFRDDRSFITRFPQFYSWDNLEKRAIFDPRYAFALINSYSYTARWNTSTAPFYLKFPHLFQHITTKAKEGDPYANFSLGFMYINLGGNRTHFGQNVDPGQMRKLFYEAFKKAYDLGHTHAAYAIGWLYMEGRLDSTGANYIEALPWFLESKKSQGGQQPALTRVLSYSGHTPKVQGTFQEEVTSIKDLLNKLLGIHDLHIKSHTPGGKFKEAPFVIPQFAKAYIKIREVEEEAFKMATLLEKTSPGFLMAGVTINCRPSDVQNMLSRQSNPPKGSIIEIEKRRYLTVGETNVKTATAFLSYLEGVDQRFAHAKKQLLKMKKYHKLGVESAIGELATRRLLALQNLKDTSLTQSFSEQQKRVELLESLVEKPLAEIKEGLAGLSKVRKSLKRLLASTEKQRDQSFIDLLK